MKAYALIAPFREEFSTDAMVGAFKEAKITDFTKLPWREGTVSDKKGTKGIILERDEVLYLFGGRDALEKALTPCKAYYIGTSAENYSRKFALFRAQRATKVLNKVRQVLMITTHPDVYDILTERWVGTDPLFKGLNTEVHIHANDELTSTTYGKTRIVNVDTLLMIIQTMQLKKK